MPILLVVLALQALMPGATSFAAMVRYAGADVPDGIEAVLQP